MKTRWLQCFFACLVALLSSRESGAAEAFRFSLRDVDGNDVALADGHVTIVTIVTRANQHDARVVADRVPRRYYGDDRLRMLMIGNLQGRFPQILHRFVTAFVRHRLELEAKRLRPIYQANHAKHDPRQDLHVLLDFDGAATARFGVRRDERLTHVFVLRRDGQVAAHWTKLPDSEQFSDLLDRELGSQ